MFIWNHIIIVFFERQTNFKKLIFKKSEVMERVINRKLRFIRWLNSGIILPLTAMALISTVVLYSILFIVIK